ncbi:MAG: glycosyltransferase [Roseiflexaceae bacterium]|jgi:glycosyltransferase involved in cell wall biosynthesis
MNSTQPHIYYVAYPTSLTLASANAVQTYSTLRELKKLAPQTQIFIPRMTRAPNPFDELGVNYLPRIGIGRLSRLYKSTLWYYMERSVFAWLVVLNLLWRHWRGMPVDVIYVREVICAYWLSRLAPRWCHAKVVYEVHHVESSNHSRPKEAWAQPLVAHLDDITLKRPTRLVSLTHAFRTVLANQQLRQQSDVDVLPDAYNDALYTTGDQQTARQRLGLSADDLIITYAGLTFAYRRLDLLVRAFAELDPTLRQRCTLIFVGGRPQEVQELRTLVTALHIDESVTFVGVLPQTTVAEYLVASDILAIPDTVTDETASPLKLFEYMATGRVVICPEMPALREIIGQDGACTFARGNQASLTANLSMLLHDAQLRATYAAAGLRAVAPHTYRNRAATLVDICSQALKSQETA